MLQDTANELPFPTERQGLVSSSMPATVGTDCVAPASGMTAPRLIQVEDSKVAYSPEAITSHYTYQTSVVERNGPNGEQLTVRPVARDIIFRTQRQVPRVGVLMVGMGGNNGSTVMGGVLANRLGLKWETRRGVQSPDYIGSITQASTVCLGNDSRGQPVYAPMHQVLPMVHPNDLVLGGWDISATPMDAAMRRANVFHVNLQKLLEPHMAGVVPMPSIYYPDFIAANQSHRADNVLPGSRACREHVEHLRADIRKFKESNGLDKVIVLWTANTERYCEVTDGVHDTEENFMRALEEGHDEIAPSQVFAAAAILEGCAYINGSPQNTFVPALIAMARRMGVYIGGDDFKSGQTKIKSVLVDFLVSAGIKPESIVSYNHLGNNDGKNLSSHKQFRSKEISKSSVVDDMVASNRILYHEGEHPDHCVVIKYVPFVRDSKRAMDEYISTIFMGGLNTLAIHNTCEDSLLAAPIILDLVVLTELFQRIEYKLVDAPAYEKFDAILTVLSYLLKAPLTPRDVPVVNALFKQRACIDNILRACVGLPPQNDMRLEHCTSLTLGTSPQK